MAYALLPSQNKSIHCGSADKHRLRAQREGLGDIRTTPHPGIKQNIDLLPYRRNDPGESVQTANSPIDLSPAVVTHYNPLTARGDGFLGVRHGLDALENNRPVPVLPEEGNVLPAVADGGEDNLRPFRGGGVHVVFDVDAVFRFEMGPEDGVGETDRYADFVGAEEGAVPFLTL
jgi:hypothetical protein